jgi:pilus assembly protein CpaF
MEKLKAYLINAVSREFTQITSSSDERTVMVQESLNNAYQQTGVNLPESLRVQLFRDVMHELIGFGPIQDLLDEPDVTEVMVNRPEQIYIERKGKLIDTKVKFDNEEHIMRIIERIVSPLGRRVDTENPMVDASKCGNPPGFH